MAHRHQLGQLHGHERAKEAACACQGALDVERGHQRTAFHVIPILWCATPRGNTAQRLPDGRCAERPTLGKVATRSGSEPIVNGIPLLGLLSRGGIVRGGDSGVNRAGEHGLELGAPENRTVVHREVNKIR